MDNDTPVVMDYLPAPPEVRLAEHKLGMAAQNLSYRVPCRDQPHLFDHRRPRIEPKAEIVYSVDAYGDRTISIVPGEVMFDDSKWRYKLRLANAQEICAGCLVLDQCRDLLHAVRDVPGGGRAILPDGILAGEQVRRSTGRPRTDDE